LDSSAIVDLLRGGQKGDNIQHLLEGKKLLTSVICYCEVLNQSEGPRQAQAKSFMSSLLVLPVTVSDGDVAEQMQYSCRKSGGHVRTMDCLVAATAFNHGATLVATDSDFERIDGLKKHLF